MASASPQTHPTQTGAPLILHLTDASLVPLITSAHPPTKQYQALTTLTTASLSAYTTASRLGLGLPQRIMLETSALGPAVLQSFLDPRASRAHPTPTTLSGAGSGAGASGPGQRIPHERPNGTRLREGPGDEEGRGHGHGQGLGLGLDELSDRALSHVSSSGGGDLEIGARNLAGSYTHNPHLPYNPALGLSSTLLNGSHADVAQRDVLREESIGFEDTAGAGGGDGGDEGQEEQEEEEEEEEEEGEGEEESEEARPPMLVATVVAPRYAAVREARRAAARLERMGSEFQRRWVEERGRDGESEADEEEDEEEEEDG